MVIWVILIPEPQSVTSAGKSTEFSIILTVSPVVVKHSPACVMY